MHQFKQKIAVWINIEGYKDYRHPGFWVDTVFNSVLGVETLCVYIPDTGTVIFTTADQIEVMPDEPV